MIKKIFAPKVYPLNEDLNRAWFVKYYDKTGRPCKKYGKLSVFNTVAEKRKEAARIIKKLLEPDWQPTLPKYNDFASALADRLEYKRPAIEPKSYQSYFSILKLFTAWYRKERINNKHINPAEYVRHLQINGYHKNTIRNKILVLKGLTNEIIEDGLLNKNPFEKIKLKKVKAKSKLPFSREQVYLIKQYLLNYDKQLWEACEFLYYLYLRPNEVRSLKVEDIIYTEWRVFLSGNIAKDDDNIYKAVPIPLRNKLLQYQKYPTQFYLFSYGGLPGLKMLSRDNLSKRFAAVLKALNISNRYSFYSWVHTGIKDAAMSGIPLKQLQLQKGHHDLNMFNEYMKDLGVDDCLQLINNFPSL
ncbi:MAG: site-specific integrase [Chitinophagaceae bacterium]|nr:site-specific integrase [Chitinophagaceae bacterium]